MNTPSHATEPLGDLLARFLTREELKKVKVEEASLATAVTGGSEPLNIIAYITDLGIVVGCVEDLLLVNSLDDEEELSAHRVAEGVAVSIASQGTWILFRS